jgi:putative oxidoreductase
MYWTELVNLSKTQGYFNLIGLPAELALLIGLLEVVGGFFLIFGLLTRIIGLLFAIEMISAFIIVNISSVVILPEGYELGLLSIPILFMTISISLMLTGPGRFSVEWNIIKRELISGGKGDIGSLKMISTSKDSHHSPDSKMTYYHERELYHDLSKSSSMISSITNYRQRIFSDPTFY